MKNPARTILAIAFVATLRPFTVFSNEADDIAGLALKSASFDQGLCLVVNESDGKLTAALAKASRMTVQGCSWDAKNVQTARETIVSAKLSDRASSVWCEAEGLPYADGLVNLLVAPAWGSKPIEMTEVLRVLAPGGTAILGNDGSPDATNGLEAKLKSAGITEHKALSRKGWITFKNSVNPDFDSWTHLNGSADMSCVNNDKAVAPIEEIRWIGDPRWGALYLTYEGVVTAGGRIYYKENRAAIGGTQSFLIARDAYNGFELWRIPVGAVWTLNYIWSDTSLTCDERRVYLVEDKVLVARDGLSGKKLHDFAPGFVPDTVTAAGAFLVASNKSTSAALDEESGKVLWNRPSVVHPAVADGVAFVLGKTELEAVSLNGGSSLWKTKVEPAPVNAVIRTFCKGGVVYVSYAPPYKAVNFLGAFDAKSGNPLWKKEGSISNYGIFPYKEETWILSKDQGKADSVSAQVLDPKTGTVKKEVSAKGKVPDHCNPSKGSANFLLYSNSWFLDTKSGTATCPKTVRTPCKLGQCPANGLTYFLPHHCNCGVTLRGFLALSKAGSKKWIADAANDGNSLLYSAGGSPAAATEKPDDWPMFRKDTRRSNASAAKLPEQLKLLWSEKLGESRLIQSTVAYGLVCTAEPKTHRVFARDAASSKELWSFTADGRVEFPPTLHKGLCLFGTGGGSVYCLNALTGKEIWRLRVAPAQKYLAEEGQFASVWPVIGGVMPLDGTIYFTCGRSVQPEGLWLIAADATTGAIRWRKRGGSCGDLFVSDGKGLILTGVRYGINDCKLIGGDTTKGVLQTTKYGNEIALADYMASVEPALSKEKHNSLTDGFVRGENLAFGDKLSVAAYHYCFHMPADMKKTGRDGQLFIYAASEGKNTWLLDDKIAQQMIGVVLAGDTAYLAGVPTSQNPKDKSELWVVAGADGKKLQVLTLDNRPVYDGLSAAGGRLYLATEEGQLECFGNK